MMRTRRVIFVVAAEHRRNEDDRKPKAYNTCLVQNTQEDDQEPKAYATCLVQNTKDHGATVGACVIWGLGLVLNTQYYRQPW